MLVKRLVRKLSQQEEIGLALLATGTGFAVHSALNPSIFTISKFVGSEEDRAVLKKSANIALVVNLIISSGLFFAFKRSGLVPAIANAAIGTGLWAYQHHILKEPQTQLISQGLIF